MIRLERGYNAGVQAYTALERGKGNYYTLFFLDGKSPLEVVE